MTSGTIDDPFGGRSIQEWIGRTPDAHVPDKVRDRVFARAQGRCHLTGRKIMPRDVWQLEHVTPLSMGGQHREANLAPALVDAHREKTAKEAGERSKADRVRRKHTGTWPPSKARIQSRPFGKSRLWQPSQSMDEVGD